MPVYVFSNNDQGAEWNVPQYYWPSIIKGQAIADTIADRLHNLKKDLLVEVLQSIIDYLKDNPSLRISSSISRKLKILHQMVWNSTAAQKLTRREKNNLDLLLNNLFRCIGDKDHDGRPDVMFSILQITLKKGGINLPLSLLKTAILDSRFNMVRYFKDFGNGEGDGTTLGNDEVLRIVAFRGNPMHYYTEETSHGRYTIIRENLDLREKERQRALKWILDKEKSDAKNLMLSMQKQRVTPLIILRNAVNRANAILKILEAVGLSLRGKRLALKDFSRFGIEGKEVWNILLSNGYINGKGDLQPKFNGVYKEFDLGPALSEKEKRKIFLFLHLLPLDLRNAGKIDLLIALLEKIANRTLTNEHLLATYTDIPLALKKLGEDKSGPGKTILEILKLTALILPGSAQTPLEIHLKNSAMQKAIKELLLEICGILRDVQHKGPSVLQPIYFSKFVGKAWAFFDRWSFDWRRDAYNLEKVAKIVQQINSVEDTATFINYYLRFFYAHPGKPGVSYSFPLRDFYKLSRAARGVVKEGMPRITCATYAIIANYLLKAAGYKGTFVGLYHTNLLQKRSLVMGHCILFAEKRTAQKTASETVIFVNNERVYTISPFETNQQNIKAEAIRIYQNSLGKHEHIIISPVIITANEPEEIENRINKRFDNVVMILLSYQYYSAVSETLEEIAYLQKRESAYLLTSEGKAKINELHKKMNYLAILLKHLANRGNRLIKKNNNFVKITLPMQKGSQQIKYRINNPRNLRIALSHFIRQHRSLRKNLEQIHNKALAIKRIYEVGMLGAARNKSKPR